ncbi:terpene synthase family protein [Streptomyces qinglanensis]|uniref:Terpene synthase n=1 Tax=Streptomyces qinglanensis TaxID=943816 RepID=A0A1H9WFM4_9ACTN|nr:hypothetical protein [Streptomyces qinglanensis]SES32635.1 hypothetical protein SAMN05421870_11791 [Streptomyces qinglanensis]
MTTAVLPVPSFWCPLPGGQQTGAYELGAAAARFVHDYGLESDPVQLRRLEQADFGGLTTRTVPAGKGAVLTWIARLHATLFALDDGMCDEGEPAPEYVAAETIRLEEVLTPGTLLRPDDSPFGRALQAIAAGLAEHADPQQMDRWRAGMRTYLSALPAETAFRRSEGLPVLQEYLPVWMGAIGMAPATALLPVALGRPVPVEELNRADVGALTEITWTLVALDNDLYSRPKEIARADDDLNVVDVLAAEHGWDAARALHEAIVLRDRVMALFLALSRQVTSGADAPLRHYVRALGQFVRGHVEWASRSSRYTSEAPATADGWFTEVPADSSLRPVAVPRIAWWWEQLAV